MLIDIPLPLARPLRELARAAQWVEALGFAGVTVADHAQHGRDAFVALAQVATATSRVTLYPAATNPVTRHPVVLATLARSLAELAPGRVKMALAPGDAALLGTGLRPATVSRMRSAVLSVQRLLVGREVDGLSQRATGPAPPVMLTASRPRLLELAGELADEALVMAGLEPTMLAAARAAVELGLARSGRSATGFPVTHYVLLAVDDDAWQARERARNWLHLWLSQGQFTTALEASGLAVPSFRTPEEIPPSLLARLCDALFVVGTPTDVAGRLQALAHGGVERVALFFPGGARPWERTVQVLADTVLPVLP